MSKPATPGSAYSEAEKRKVARLYPEAPRADVLAALPGRTWLSIRNVADDLRLSRSRTTNDKWRGKPLELVRKHYPKRGPHYVAALLGEGYTADSVRGVAKRNGIECLVKGHHTKPRAPRKPKPATPNGLKLQVQPPQPAELVQPVKRSPATPLLNARIEARRKAEKEQAGKPKPFVTAAEIRALPAAHPARLAWTIAAHRGPAAATEAFHAAMKQAA